MRKPFFPLHNRQGAMPSRWDATRPSPAGPFPWGTHRLAMGFPSTDGPTLGLCLKEEGQPPRPPPHPLPRSSSLEVGVSTLGARSIEPPKPGGSLGKGLN